MEEPDQGTVGPLGTADQATQRLLQGSGRTALQTRASNDGTHYRTSSKVLRPTVLLLNKKNITEGTQQEMITESTLNITYEKV